MNWKPSSTVTLAVVFAYIMPFGCLANTNLCSSENIIAATLSVDSGCHCQLNLGDANYDIHNGQVEVSSTDEQILLGGDDQMVSFSWRGCSISNITCSYDCCHESCTNLDVNIAFSIGGGHHHFTNDEAQIIAEEALLNSDANDDNNDPPQAFTASPGVQSFTASPGVQSFTAAPGIETYTASPGVDEGETTLLPSDEEGTETFHTASTGALSSSEEILSELLGETPLPSEEAATKPPYTTSSPDIETKVSPENTPAAALRITSSSSCTLFNLFLLGILVAVVVPWV
mmetsp:Transcript_4/g.5  ORF Transcript_4/g.5 Transcript_4/m.5 type:complete len:287 (-) Transcript_4:72-932(-)